MKPQPNGGCFYESVYAHSKSTVPGVRVRHVIRAAEARERRYRRIEAVLAAISVRELFWIPWRAKLSHTESIS